MRVATGLEKRKLNPCPLGKLVDLPLCDGSLPHGLDLAERRQGGAGLLLGHVSASDAGHVHGTLESQLSHPRHSPPIRPWDVMGHRTIDLGGFRAARATVNDTLTTANDGSISVLIGLVLCQTRQLGREREIRAHLILTEAIWHAPAVPTDLDIYFTVFLEDGLDRRLKLCIRTRLCQTASPVSLVDSDMEGRGTHFATNTQALGGR